MPRFVDPYPRWYTPVKWLLPLSLALGSGLIVGLAILGILPIPFAFGKLAWLPAIYGSLDTVKAVAMLGIGTSAVSAIVGVTTAFMLRATVLFQTNELRGTQGQKAQEQVEKLEETIDHLAQEREEHIRQIKDLLPSEQEIAFNGDSLLFNENIHQEQLESQQHPQGRPLGYSREYEADSSSSSEEERKTSPRKTL